MPQCPCCKKWVGNYCLECDGHPDTKALAKANARIRELEEAGAVLAKYAAGWAKLWTDHYNANTAPSIPCMSFEVLRASADLDANPTAAAMVKAAQERRT